MKQVYLIGVCILFGPDLTSSTPTEETFTQASKQSCPTPQWVLDGDFCYLVVDSTKKQYANAEEYCETQHGTASLVSINNTEENSFVRNLTTTEYFWIGLLKQGFLDPDDVFKWMDGSSLLYTQWADGFPKKDSHCIRMMPSGRWTADNCHVANYFVCKMPKLPGNIPAMQFPLAKCPQPIGPHEWIRNGNYCYHFSHFRTMKYIEGLRLCQSMVEGANMLSIHSKEENDFIFQQSRKFKVEEWWLGLVRKGKGVLSFTWLDGTKLDYTSFSPKKPSGLNDQCTDYTTSKRYGFWNIIPCNHYRERRTICKVPLVRNTTSLPWDGIPCADGWESWHAGCYQFFPDERISWSSAKKGCEKLGKGATLASIHSEQENLFVLGRMWENSDLPSELKQSFWIGLYLADQTETSIGERFHWTDGTDADFSHWAYEEPNNKYKIEDVVEAVYDYDRNWKDVSGKKQAGYVCKYSKASGTEKSSGTSGGTFAGTVIGSLIGITLLGVALFLTLSYFGVVNGPIRRSGNLTSTWKSKEDVDSALVNKTYSKSENLQTDPSI